MPLGPNPSSLYPIEGNDKLVFLKNLVTAPNIHVGEYTYFDDPNNGPGNFETYNVLYNYDYDKVKLVIGKFCAIAAESRFIMTGDHKLDAISTYPFPIFKQGWEDAFCVSDLPVKGDIIIGHDVWLGYDCLIKNGVAIGNGAVVAARAVVVKDVPAYSIVAGNPAKVVKMRFDGPTIERLQRIAWWDWDIAAINQYLSLICHLDIDRLEEAGLSNA
jgi:virginiamycin A acetyltransferase